MACFWAHCGPLVRPGLRPPECVSRRASVDHSEFMGSHPARFSGESVGLVIGHVGPEAGPGRQWRLAPNYGIADTRLHPDFAVRMQAAAARRGKGALENGRPDF